MDLSEESIKEFVRSGVHIGHRKSVRHPKMAPFIYGIRGNTEVIDVEKTNEALEQAKEFLKTKAADGASIFFVGTKEGPSLVVEEVAKELNAPYVSSRWLGGTITNFPIISKRLDYFRKLTEREKSGELTERYTKAEHLRFQRELQRLEREMGGLKEVTKLPGVLVLASLKKDKLAAKEARSKNIPVVAIVDTDTDPMLCDYPIPANDDAILSVRYVLTALSKAIQAGREELKNKKAAEALKQQEEQRLKEAGHKEDGAEDKK